MPGLLASMMRDIINGGLRIGAYPSVLKEVERLRLMVVCRSAEAGETARGATPLPSKFAAGLITGAVGSAIGNPTDIVKVRMQAESGRLGAEGAIETGLFAGRRPTYAHTADAFVSIARTEGIVGGLFKGVYPSMLRAALITSGQMASYDHSKQFLRRAGLGERESVLASSFVAGVVAASLSAPADLVKSRYMNDRASEVPLYRSGLHCAMRTVQVEGLFALWKGWTPSYLRLGPHFMVSMPLMELMRIYVFGLHPL